MKSSAARLLTLLAALAVLAVPTRDAKAAPDLKAQHLAKVLKRFPDQATPARTVENLVLRLVKRDPRHAPVYYKIALTKLAYTSEGAFQATATKLGVAITKILKRSGLSEVQIRRIEGQMFVREGYPGAPSPTPTPEPTP